MNIMNYIFAINTNTNNMPDLRDLHIITVTGPDINNGPGFRVTVWVSGCTHKCPGCQNAHTWKYAQGHSICEKYKDTDITYKEKILSLLDNDNIDGITISGGDPMDQDIYALEQLQDLLVSVRKKYPNKSIWLYTGCTYEEFNYEQKQVARCCDVIIDGKYDQELRDITIPFRGSLNQRLIDVKQSIIQRKTITIDGKQFQR